MPGTLKIFCKKRNAASAEIAPSFSYPPQGAGLVFELLGSSFTDQVSGISPTYNTLSLSGAKTLQGQSSSIRIASLNTYARYSSNNFVLGTSKFSIHAIGYLTPPTGAQGRYLTFYSSRGYLGATSYDNGLEVGIIRNPSANNSVILFSSTSNVSLIYGTYTGAAPLSNWFLVKFGFTGSSYWGSINNVPISNISTGMSNFNRSSNIIDIGSSPVTGYKTDINPDSFIQMVRVYKNSIVY